MTYVALYKGKSLMSCLIRWRTWDDYTHAALVRYGVLGDPDTGDECWQVIEAWGGDGVVRRVGLDKGHTKGTVIDLYRVDVSEKAQDEAWAFAGSQVGKKYDWRGILKFITRRTGQDQGRWFCSELVAAAFEFAGEKILARIPAWKVYPGMLAYSPKLTYYGRYMVGKGWSVAFAINRG